MSAAIRAQVARYLQGLSMAAAAGVGASLVGVGFGMTPRDVLRMTAIQVCIHVGLYLKEPPARAGEKES